jgi:hypothetical protein
VAAEVKVGGVGGQEFTVESGISLCCGREFGGEERERPPVAGDFLLEDSAYVSLGSISGKGEWRSGVRVGQKSGVSKGCFCRGECGGHLGSPGELFGGTSEGVGEGFEDGGGVRNETAVEVDEAEEAL